MRRTDLAQEAWESAGAGELQGVQVQVNRDDADIAITLVRVLDARGEAALGKPCGSYITLEAPGLREGHATLMERLSRCLAVEAQALMNLPADGTFLVVGLGNRMITADALGPRTAGEILVTRHLMEVLPGDLRHRVRNVCALSPGVLGVTGLENTDILLGVMERVAPDAVIFVDALAAGSPARLGSTVQMSDAGIVPGSGVGSAVRPLTSATLGVPVLSVGVPLVIHAATLLQDAAQKVGFGHTVEELEALLQEGPADLVVTPKEVDQLLFHCVRVLSVGLNMLLHPALQAEEIYALLH